MGQSSLMCKPSGYLITPVILSTNSRMRRIGSKRGARRNVLERVSLTPLFLLTGRRHLHLGITLTSLQREDLYSPAPCFAPEVPSRGLYHEQPVNPAAGPVYGNPPLSVGFV